MCQLILMGAMKWVLSWIIFLLVGVAVSSGWANSSSQKVIKKICSGTCSGTLANVATLVNSRGAVKYYHFTGSLQSCSHPPSVIYDLKGNVVASMAEHPVNSSDQAQSEAIKKWQGFLKDLTETKMVFCGDVLK